MGGTTVEGWGKSWSITWSFTFIDISEYFLHQALCALGIQYLLLLFRKKKKKK